MDRRWQHPGQRDDRAVPMAKTAETQISVGLGGGLLLWMEFFALLGIGMIVSCIGCDPLMRSDDHLVAQFYKWQAYRGRRWG